MLLILLTILCCAPESADSRDVVRSLWPYKIVSKQILILYCRILADGGNSKIDVICSIISSLKLRWIKQWALKFSNRVNFTVCRLYFVWDSAQLSDRRLSFTMKRESVLQKFSKHSARPPGKSLCFMRFLLQVFLSSS